MRRIAVTLVLPMLAIGLLAGCGGSPAQSSTTSAVTVSGVFGKNPTITIPAQKATKALKVKTVIHGTGPALGKTDAFVGNYAIYIWSGTSHRLAQSSFQSHEPTLFAGRVLAVIPPKDAFGSSGNPQVGIKGTDTLVFVVDLIKNFKGNASATGQQVSSGGSGLPKVTATTGAAPKIKVPSGKPPAKLVTKVLVKGSGPVVKAKQTVVVQYVGVLWRSGKGSGTVFDASWKRDQPFSFIIGSSPSQVIPGWDKGLVGQTVGSRVMLVIPPADGYGKTGNSQAGIKPTDTLVFVVDLLGAF